ncbi:MAG: hypothetical protein NT069_32840 [Planctomycetota bacterium]|nr:hypothetical protein [Planctomycetota bacterium]
MGLIPTNAGSHPSIEANEIEMPPHNWVADFAYSHLPVNQVAIARQFAELACAVAYSLPKGQDRINALLKLKEARDTAMCIKPEGLKTPSEITMNIDQNQREVNNLHVK